MFCDKAKVILKAGKGGSGCVSFRREKFVAKGGPDGGDGGKGGSILLVANENLNTLNDFNTKKLYKAEDGEGGKGKNMTGVSGENLTLEVPVGTIVIDPESKEILVDLDKDKKKAILVNGGEGGHGNSSFATSIIQAPRFAEIGQPGEEIEVILELKMIAEVGIIGLPSAGKSTLISRISNAKPKIADYPFTTLVPNLGITHVGKVSETNINDSFLVADIPGLIEGAHQGKGLGDEFLKHVARTKVLIHIVDLNENDLKKSYETINEELRKYDIELYDKPQIVALNKQDSVPADLAEDILEDFKKQIKKKDVHLISAVSGHGLPELILETYEIIKKLREEEKLNNVDEEEVIKVHKPHIKHLKKRFDVEFVGKNIKKDINSYKVMGRNIEKLVQMTNFDNEEAVHRIYKYLKTTGIHQILIKKGAKNEDEILIGDKTLLFIE